MKKRFAVLIVLLSVLCTLFAACGTDKEKGKESNVTTVSVSDTAAENDTEKTAQPEGIRKITLSGKAEDAFVAEKDCYTEGDGVVMYFQKGVTVRGDMLAITEKAMSDIEEYTGLDFGPNYTGNGYSEHRDLFLTEDFEGINEGAEKINVIVVDDCESGSASYAYENGAVIEERDYDFEKAGYQVVYHELSHLIHLRNGADLSPVMNEGFATYCAYLTFRAQGLPSWTHIQYFEPYDYDVTPIMQGTEGFTVCFAAGDDNYQYGFRFVMFLECTYGEGVFMKIAEAAGDKGYDASYDINNEEASLREDTEMLKEIIISQTGEDVFERFARWHETEYANKYQEYKDYMNSIGQVINW